MIAILLSLALAQSDPQAVVDVTLPDMITATGPSGEAPLIADATTAKSPSTWTAAFFVAVKSELDGTFIDYPSARFRGVKVGVRDSQRVICGMTNAKNRMGAYVGWRYLLVVETARGLLIEMEDAPTYRIRHYCVGPTAWAATDYTARITP